MRKIILLFAISFYLAAGELSPKTLTSAVNAVTNANGLNLNSMLTNNSFNFFLGDLQINCNFPGIKIPKISPNNICKNISNSVLKNAGNFNLDLGVCSFSTNFYDKCSEQTINNICDNITGHVNEINKVTNKVYYKENPSTDILVTDEQTAFYDDGQENNINNNENNNNGNNNGNSEVKYGNFTPEDIDNNTNYETIKKRNIGYNVFDSNIVLIKDCYKKEAQAGLSNAQIKKICFDTITYKLPRTTQEADQEIDKVAKEQLISPLSWSITNEDKLRTKVSLEIENRCGSSNNIEKCVDEYFSDSNTTLYAYKNIYLNKNKFYSSLLEHYIDRATLTEKSIVYQDDKTINSLPINMRADYNELKNKAKYLDIFKKYILYNEYKIRNEIADITSEEIKTTLIPFSMKNAAKEIKTVLQGVN